VGAGDGHGRARTHTLTHPLTHVYTQGCDWGLTCILVSFVVLGVCMALLAAFGQFSQWNMMGSVSKAWSADGDNDVITNGYSAHPGSSDAAPSAAVFGAADRKSDAQKTPPGATFASSTADGVRDFLGLGKDGPPSWARHSSAATTAAAQSSLADAGAQADRPPMIVKGAAGNVRRGVEAHRPIAP